MKNEDISTRYPDSRPGSQPAPAAQQPPAKRRLLMRLSGQVSTQPGRSLRGSIPYIGAQYESSGSVRIYVRLGDETRITLYLDHTQIRAAVATLRSALNALALFLIRDIRLTPHDAPTASFTCLMLSPYQETEDEELRFRFRPGSEMIQMHGHCSDLFRPNVHYHVSAELPRTEAEATLNDLECGLADFDRAGGIEP